MIWTKSLYELCIYLLSSILTETFIIFLKNSSDICLFKFWNGSANFTVTYSFPSWQNSLFCFGVLNFSLMFPTFLTHGQFSKLWASTFFFFSVLFNSKKIHFAIFKVYFTIIKLAAGFSRDDSFIHSTNRHRALVWSRAGPDAEHSLRSKAWPHPQKAYSSARRETLWPEVSSRYDESTTEEA